MLGAPMAKLRRASDNVELAAGALGGRVDLKNVA